ncbi:MAG: DUF1501 domain-containing protein [Planctomycetota bacterium]|jgi:hypothetical protein
MIRRSTRRSFLRIASVAPWCATGANGLARNPQASPLLKTAAFGTAKSCVLLWLDGGPSHLETFDPKIDVPREVQGPLGTVATSLPGVHFSQELRRCAKLADRMTIVRSMTSPLGEHGLANQYALTGYLPSPNLQYPSLGSLAAYDRRDSWKDPLPRYVGIPEPQAALGSGFLGSSEEPFWIHSDPGSPSFKVRDLEFYPTLDPSRLERRRQMLEELQGVGSKGAYDSAFDLITSEQAKEVFDLNRETQESKERYGLRSFGQSCLLARRLIERKVPFVTVVQPGWDTHENMVVPLRDGYSGAKVGVGLIPTFDQAVSALIEDLSQRGLLDETLVIAMGEFGRTPKVNTRGGRDHWPRVYSVMLCGGGLPQGFVYGSSDRIGESPRDNPTSPADLIRTVLIRLGVDPDIVLRTPDGRPIPINQHGKPIDALL